MNKFTNPCSVIDLHRITFQAGKEFKLRIEKFGNTVKQTIYPSPKESFVNSYTLDEENELNGISIWLNVFLFGKSSYK